MRHDRGVTEPVSVDDSAPSASALSAPRTARARARTEVTREILDTARRHLALEGASGLSLRAVARELHMASSAVYRYFPSRDELLTALIIESYDSLGDAAQRAEAAVRRGDLPGRWLAVCHAVRDWALANPHEYALLYGSPVPGYAAPQDTVPPGTRVPMLLLSLTADIIESGRAPDTGRVPAAVRRSLAPLRAGSGIPVGVPDDSIVRGLVAWTTLFGAVSLELFGQYGDGIADPRALFDHEMARVGTTLVRSTSR